MKSYAPLIGGSGIHCRELSSIVKICGLGPDSALVVSKVP